MTSSQHGVTVEAVRWAMRLFLGREPQNDAELAFHRGHATLDSLRAAFAGSPEFREFFRRISTQRPIYAAPLFLLAPPQDTSIPWLFRTPTLAEPVSQLCTDSQMDEDAYRFWSAQLGFDPIKHRKIWEFCYIACAMREAGMLREGVRAIGFGVGTESLPSVLAKYGVDVLATDAPQAVIQDQGWDTTNQHAADLQALFWPNLVDAERFRRHVTFRPVDMNAIPDDLAGFDMCWSACALEHLGSIDQGLAFIENSLKLLKPGGLAVHTTEFNLSSNNETLEVPQLSLFRKQDIERLAAGLIRHGHRVFPLNFHPGHGPVDEHIDVPPFALPHLKLELAEYVSTSIGLILRKAG